MKCDVVVDLEISIGRTRFSVVGDQTKLVLHFPSVVGAARAWRLLSREIETLPPSIEGMMQDTVVEARIHGIEVARIDHHREASRIATSLRFVGTRILLKNLLKAVVKSFERQQRKE